MPIKRYSVTIPIEFDLPGKTIITTEVGYACYAETSEQAVEATKLFLADESEKIIDAISEGVFDGIRAFADEVPLSAEPKASEVDKRSFKSSRDAEVHGGLLIEDLP